MVGDENLIHAEDWQLVAGTTIVATVLAVGAVTGGAPALMGALVTGAGSFAANVGIQYYKTGTVDLEEALGNAVFDAAMSLAFAGGLSIFGKTLSTIAGPFLGQAAACNVATFIVQWTARGISAYQTAQSVNAIYHGNWEEAVHMAVGVLGGRMAARGFKGNCFVAETPVAVGWGASVNDVSMVAPDEAGESLSAAWLIGGAGVLLFAINLRQRIRKHLDARNPQHAAHNHTARDRWFSARASDELWIQNTDPEPKPNGPPPDSDLPAATAINNLRQEPVMKTEPTKTTASATSSAAPSRKRFRFLTTGFLASLLFVSGFCFFKAGLFNAWSTPAGATTFKTPPPRELLTRPIADIQPGHRVLAGNPLEDEWQDGFETVDPMTWAQVKLRLRKADGSRLDVTLLRPQEWFEFNAIRVGKTFDLDLPELGAKGAATVLNISACPPIETGVGRTVTGKFVHESAQVLDITVTGEAEPIGTTASHPFWSEDRRKFIPADDLRLGETLRRANGLTARVKSITPRPGTQRVYNLEVNVEHVYHVGRSGVLVHNMCATDSPSPFKRNKAGNWLFHKKITNSKGIETTVWKRVNKTRLPASKLRERMGLTDPTTDAHHIVARRHPKAKRARDILEAEGIDVDGELNGVELPRNSKVGSTKKGAYHLEEGHNLHNDDYFKAVNKRLERFKGDKQGLIAELGRIRADLLNGTMTGVTAGNF